MPKDSTKKPSAFFQFYQSSNPGDKRGTTTTRACSKITADSAGGLSVKNSRIEITVPQTETAAERSTGDSQACSSLDIVETQCASVNSAPENLAQSDVDSPTDPAYVEHIKQSDNPSRKRVREPGVNHLYVSSKATLLIYNLSTSG